MNNDKIEELRRKADEGDANAQLVLGTCYANGTGVEKSPFFAFEWFRKAAEQDDAEAQFMLGACYANGAGVEKDPVQAAEWFRKAAEQGHAEAQFILGHSYDYGNGVDTDSAKAAEWYRKAAEQGHVHAQFNLGTCYDSGDGVARDPVQAVEWYRRAGEQGHPMAQFNMGLCYDAGDGVARDTALAAEWYRKAAEQEIAAAQSNLGVLYANGDGVARDPVQAVEWLHKAAAAGLRQAQLNLGNCYRTGEGVEKDLAQAVAWYRRAAEQGLAEAQFNLGLCYYKGDSVEKDRTKASEWIRKAAEQGYTDAQFILGDFFRTGIVCGKDLSKALDWYRRAAERGHADAQFLLGGYLHIGRGVEKDPAQAAIWYRKAAEQGLAEAQFNLGLCYMKGDGVEKDYVSAFDWFHKAASAGFGKAALCKRLRDNKNLAPHIISFLALSVAVEEVNSSADSRDIEHVCHFTDLDTLYSILSLDSTTGRPAKDSNLLRMYNISYVNDPTEGQALILQSKDKNGPLHTFFESPPSKDQGVESYSEYVYFAAFTERKDRLDLWRAYGRDGLGFCIVIPREVFGGKSGESCGMVLCSDVNYGGARGAVVISQHRSGFKKVPGEPAGIPPVIYPSMTLFRVRYSEIDKDAALENLRGPLQVILKIRDELEKKEDKDETNKIVRDILADILYLYKNEEYDAEKESRIISFRSPEDPLRRLDEGRRPNSIRHLYIPTRPFLFERPGYEIIIGPKWSKRENDAIRKELEFFLQQRGFSENVTIIDSEVPYR